MVSSWERRQRRRWTRSGAMNSSVTRCFCHGRWKHFRRRTSAESARSLCLVRLSLRCLTSSTMWVVCYRSSKKGSPYSITERRVPELMLVLGSQPADDVSHKPGGRLPLLSSRPAVTLATLKRAATDFAAWWTEARWVWTVCLRLLPDNVETAVWTQALLRLSPAH